MADNELETFLASLEDDESQEQKPKPDISLEKLGYAYRQEQKDKKKLAKENEELRQYREEREAKDKAEILVAAGLTEGQAKAFRAMYSEISPESIAAFKTDVLGLTGEAPEARESAPERPETSAPRDQGFASPSFQGGSPVINKPTITRAEFDKMVKNPATRQEAVRMANEGRVEHSELSDEVQVTDPAGFFNRIYQ